MNNTSDQKRKKVLIIEDDFFVGDIYRKKFSDEGFSTFLAHNGEEAIASIQAGFIPDIILLDLIMPIMDGRDFLRQVKTFPFLSSTPILVLSNLSEEEDIGEALELGAKDYIVKSRLTPLEVFDRAGQILKENNYDRMETS